MKNEELQKKLDETKWNDSVVVGKDQCGNYEYCPFCNKSNKTPCASALNKLKRNNKAEVQKDVSKEEI